MIMTIFNLETFYLITNFFIGTCIASFACVLAENGINLTARSKCNHCHQTLRVLDLIPLVSFIFLKGYCHYCHKKIPRELFYFELAGGFYFLKIDYSNFFSYFELVFLFFFFLIAILDLHHQEFLTALLIVPAIISATTFLLNLKSLTLLDSISLLIMFSAMSILVYLEKMGLGDLLIYVLIACFYGQTYANLAFLISSLLVLVYFGLNRKINFAKTSLPFIPFVIASLIVVQLI